MSQSEAIFTIKPESVSGALAAIKSLAGKETISDASGRHFSWVDTSEFVEAETLSQATKAWRWEIEVDEETGAVQGIEFYGEKLGDDNVFFEALAPFVEAGSYIQMHGEDGEIWRWIFDGKTVEEKSATISF